MKLNKVVNIRFSLLIAIILLIWSIFFYYAIINEVNDEVDDSLEDYAEMIIIRSVRGEELPQKDIGSNNQYFIREITPQYANSNRQIRYTDRDVYIEEKREFEPARVLTYIFQDDDEKFYELEVSTPHIDKTDLKEAIFYWTVFLFASLLLLAILLNIWLIYRTMRPLKVILKWLENYNLGNSKQQLSNPTKIDEFKALNDVVQSSINRIEETYNQQKLFIANASHEIQTPLAICINRLELLANDNTLSESQLGEIVKTKNTIEQLSQINRSLLLLSKIENGQFTENKRADIGDIFKKLLPDFELIYRNLNVRSTLKEDGKFLIDMDESLSNTLITNLLKNAFVHNVTNGNIEISITAESFSISNSGENVPLDKEKIFENFYHSHSSEHHSGLGLSIVRAICRRYDLNIEYDFIKNSHTFKIFKK